MPRVIVLMVALLCIASALGQSSSYTSRAQALKGLDSQDSVQRAEALSWIAAHGKPADGKILQQRLDDESPLVRGVAEQGLWLLWSRSGDKAVDALLARGVEQMQSGRLKESIATFSEVIRRRPAFAEGWNKRATALFLAGEFRKSLSDCDEVMKRNPYHFGALEARAASEPEHVQPRDKHQGGGRTDCREPKAIHVAASGKAGAQGWTRALPEIAGRGNLLYNCYSILQAGCP
jgi:tetratricopeptide (TPR) repeat protein